MNKIALLLAPLLVLSVIADDAFPTDRRSGLTSSRWDSAGISGGIPAVTSIYTTLTSANTLTDINTAIANCPSNQVVKLDAGTYNLGGVINLTKDGVVLRGATNSSGMPTTLLNNCQVRINTYYSPCGGQGNFPAVSVRGVSSGYTEGSTSIILSSAPNSDFAEGAVFVLDQTDDSINVFPDANCGYYVRCGRAYAQVLYCTGISGNTLTFTPPLVGTYWHADRTPQVYGWNNVYGPTRKRAGLEDVDITEGTVGTEYQTIKWMGGYECWIKNVRVNLTPYAATALMWCVNSEIRQCIIHDASDNGSGCYGTGLFINTACRVEDNTYTNLSLGITMSSVVGSSVSYNYGTGPYPYSLSTWLAEYFFPHGGHSHHTLFEGNWLGGPIYVDSIFGNSDSDIGIVRNRVLGWASGKTLNTTPISLENNKHRTTIIGNILGEDSYHTLYSQMYYIAASSSSTTIRTNNYNTVTDGVNGVEAIGANTVADSYTYANKPTFFGDLPTWPPFDPGDYASAAYTNIPAGYRSFTGQFPGPPPDDDLPTLSSATIPTPGTTIQLVFSELINIGAGGSGGWTMTMSGGAVTLTYSSGAGTTTLVYSLSRTISSGETVTAGLDYTQPGNGLEDSTGNDLATIDDASVVNNSTYSGEADVPPRGRGFGRGAARGHFK